MHILLLGFFVWMSAPVRADHSNNSGPGASIWQFHWIDSEAIEFNTTMSNWDFEPTRLEKTDSGGEGQPVYFSGTVNWSEFDDVGCPSERAITLLIDWDVYQNLDTSTPTPIQDGSYGQAGNGTCDIINEVINGFRNEVFVVGFTSETNTDGFSQLGSGSSDDDVEIDPSCEGTNIFNLNWWLCGVLQIMDSTILGLGREVDGLLNISDEYYNDEQLQQAWSYFRNLASLLLVLIGLVMIIGQAVSKD